MKYKMNITKLLFIINLILIYSNITYVNDSENKNSTSSYEDINSDIETKLNSNLSDNPKLTDFRTNFVALDNTYLTIDKFTAPFNRLPSIGEEDKSILVKGNVVKALYRNQELVQYGRQMGYWYLVEIDDMYCATPPRGWVYGGWCSIFSDRNEAIDYAYEITEGTRKRYDSFIKGNNNVFAGLKGLGYIDGRKNPVPVYLTPFPISEDMIMSRITGELWTYAAVTASSAFDDDPYATYRQIFIDNSQVGWVRADDVLYVQTYNDNYETNEAVALLSKGGIINNDYYDCHLLFLKYYTGSQSYQIVKMSDMFYDGALNMKVEFGIWDKNKMGDKVIRGKFYPGFGNETNGDFISSLLKDNWEISWDGNFIWDNKFEILGRVYNTKK